MSKKFYSTKGNSASAFFFMLLGGALMIVLVVSFNKSVKEKEPVVKKEFRQIHAAKTQKQVTKPKPKPKPKPKKAQPKAPLPNMNSLLGGVSMDIPEFVNQESFADATELLKDINDDAIMNENTVDVKPKVVSRPPLEYPREALQNGIKGYVIVNILVGKDGSVEIAKILDSKPSGVFDSAALNAVNGWRFSPAKYKLKPVKIWVKQKISFK
ncbi:energy transducer TonB [Sulfurimonas marina]|uniref:Energy transducer TonB n=1 Tax=Sulfurimonas marina TaxID=2590551 RepID=A0A7M1AX15_9BACT|nr:energy transducer TonB [Sulfurimonas marina]QOP41999.1 energy transducer TonB [Sulfurimonas marina]